MDNLLTGADDLESGRKLQEQLVSLLRGAEMELHKWSASNPLLLPDSMCQDKDLSYSSSTETKTLGLLWKPHPDSFAFKISPMTSNCDSLIVTKKSVISAIARKFDPLGLIGPVITRAKIFLQSLCQLKLDWNYPLPSNLVSYCISPDKIQHCGLRWFGPPFLHQYKELEPYDTTAVEGDDLFLQELKETSDIPLCALLKTSLNCWI
ncbi:DUF5641 domain-containing protein [Trichonephila clavata]|uniref:DUF5641 domain-containing protein n=1 Tax=Trichonephila clavata TaxID=2740835 RepID=A0A8X6HFX1_TRICU|nr:DUF5641 domain-containing protein [Trichonephila clavata]